MALIRSAVLFALAAFTASAVPITWTLNNVTRLGTSITGSFVYDSDTFAYSAINIVTQGGDVIPSATFIREIACCSGHPQFLQVVDSLAINQTGADTVELNFSTFLTDAGGSHSLYVFEGICVDPTCLNLNYYPNEPFTTTFIGTVNSGPSTPEPGSSVLLGTGLLALGALRRREWL